MTRKTKKQGHGWPFSKTPKYARDLIDYDYLNQLSPEELQYLEDFTKAEYLNDHESLKKIDKKKSSTYYKRKANKKNYSRRVDAMNRINLKGEIIKTVESNPETINSAKEELRLRVSKTILRRK